VLLEGETHARDTLDVKVWPKDADRALAVVRALLSKVQSLFVAHAYLQGVRNTFMLARCFKQ